jgi:hypothetical protein
MKYVLYAAFAFAIIYFQSQAGAIAYSSCITHHTHDQCDQVRQ